jgi:hypothetical protein
VEVNAMHDNGEKKSGKAKWVVLGCGGCALLVVLLAAFVAAVLGIAFTAVKSSDAYRTAVERASEHPLVIDALGEPIEDGLLVTGSVNVSGSSGEASLAIPISGPKGRATVYVEAQKSAGEWHFQVLEVEIAGRSGRIDLLAEPEPATIAPSTSAVVA